MVLGFHSIIINIFYNIFNSCLIVLGFKKEKVKDDPKDDDPKKIIENKTRKNDSFTFIDIEKQPNTDNLNYSSSLKELDESIIFECKWCNEIIKRRNEEFYIQHVAFGDSFCNVCWECNGAKKYIHRKIFSNFQ